MKLDSQIVLNQVNNIRTLNSISFIIKFYLTRYLIYLFSKSLNVKLKDFLMVPSDNKFSI